MALDDVRRIARLARIEIDESELPDFAARLDRVLEYVARLEEVDVADVGPMAHAAAARDVFREDDPRPSLDRTDALANAPDHDDEHVRVPRTV